MHGYPNHLTQLILSLKKLPGVGSRTAERFAFQLLNWKEEQRLQLANLIATLPQKVIHCPECGALSDERSCLYCTPERQQSGRLCIVAKPRDLLLIEQTGEYKGLYHVLGGLLSPLDNIDQQALRITPLLKRIQELSCREVIIALDATLEGDTTALLLKEQLKLHNITITRLAFGIPLGSSFDLVDGSTLARAFASRLKY